MINMQQYPECTSASFCTLDQQLVKVILSKERMRSDYEIVVDGCLMKLPAKYLDVAQFEKAHTKLNEFTLRSRSVRYHSGSLNQREKEAIMKKCLDVELNSQELKELKELQVMEQETITNLYESVLKCVEDEKVKWESCAIETEIERDHEKQKRIKTEQEVFQLKQRVERAEKEGDKNRATIELYENTTKTLFEIIGLLIIDSTVVRVHP